MSKLELPYVTVTFDAPIVYYTYKQGAELGFPEMKEVIRAAEKLSWSRPYFTFSDVRAKMNVTPEGRKYIMDFRHMPYFRGAAVLVSTSMMKVALNFFSYFQKKKYPLKAFTSKEKALEWLNTLPLDNESPEFAH